MNMAANVICNYQIRLTSERHSFKTDTATHVAQSADTKLHSGFASFEFLAAKS